MIRGGTCYFYHYGCRLALRCASSTR
jgi:hypothetical protein